MRASVPERDIEDVRALALEKDLSEKVGSAQQLWQSIQSYAPATGQGVVRPADQPDDLSWTSLSASAAEQLEMRSMMAVLTPEGARLLDQSQRWGWMQFFNFVEQA